MPPQMKKTPCSMTDTMYTAEIIFPALLRQSRWVINGSISHQANKSTTNRPDSTVGPEYRAAHYFIPAYTTCHFQHCLYTMNLSVTTCESMASHYLTSILDHVEHTYPFWNITGGADHVVMFTYDRGASIVGWEADVLNRVGKARHLTTYGTVKKGKFFDPHKDVVVPPFVERPSWMGVSDGGRDRKEIKSPRERHTLAFFRGTVVNDQTYSGGVRQALLTLSQIHPTRFVIRTERDNGYWLELLDTVFALCPEGWVPWTPRPFFGLLAGAVPVIISDDLALPFEDLINWRKAIVRIGRSEVDQLPSLLEDLRNKTREAMWKEDNKDVEETREQKRDRGVDKCAGR
ncbi:hypothetical protein HDU93_001645 [Gonapodya sp. JEL0774]|nr:hypothetical protein HDU93_001645 [Gonapodya sp. JEL0774]